MRLWNRRPPGRHRVGTEREQSTPSPPATVSPETERALSAARRAAEDLAEARRVRRKIDRLGDEIDRENSKNGFRLIIESALGGNA